MREREIKKERKRNREKEKKREEREKQKKRKKKRKRKQKKETNRPNDQGCTRPKPGASSRSLKCTAGAHIFGPFSAVFLKLQAGSWMNREAAEF